MYGCKGISHWQKAFKPQAPVSITVNLRPRDPAGTSATTATTAWAKAT